MPNVSIVIGFGFQSTPPVKAATLYPQATKPNSKISIHAAREGGDLNAAEIRGNFINFNPRRP